MAGSPRWQLPIGQCIFSLQIVAFAPHADRGSAAGLCRDRLDRAGMLWVSCMHVQLSRFWDFQRTQGQPLSEWGRMMESEPCPPFLASTHRIVGNLCDVTSRLRFWATGSSNLHCMVCGIVRVLSSGSPVALKIYLMSCGDKNDNTPEAW